MTAFCRQLGPRIPGCFSFHKWKL